MGWRLTCPIAAPPLQLCLRLIEVGDPCTADVLHDLLHSILGTSQLPTDPPLSLREWMASLRADKPSRDSLRVQLDGWMTQVPPKSGWRRLEDIKPLEVAVGRGLSLAVSGATVEGGGAFGRDTFTDLARCGAVNPTFTGVHTING